jgi:HEAT repeat protein
MWERLGSAPEDQAAELVAKMASGGHRVVELIQKLPPVQVLDEQALQGLVKKLDDEQFREREAAATTIRRAGEDAVKPLKDALAASPSPEARARIEAMLKELEATDFSNLQSPEVRREIRAMRVLGEVGSVEAVRALREFATEGGMGIRAQAARQALRTM